MYHYNNIPYKMQPMQAYAHILAYSYLSGATSMTAQCLRNWANIVLILWKYHVILK